MKKVLLTLMLSIFADIAFSQLFPRYLGMGNDSTIVRSSILVNAQGKKYMVDTPSLQTVTAKGDTTNKTITYTGSGIGLNAKQYLAFGINSVEHFRISSSGNVLVKTTTDNGQGFQVGASSQFRNTLTTYFGITNQSVRLTDSSIDFSRKTDGSYSERIVGRGNVLAFISRTNFVFNSNGVDAFHIRENGGFLNAKAYVDVTPNITTNTSTSGNSTVAFQVSPVYNLTGTFSGLVRGIYYNPTLTSMVGTQHVAMEIARGDVFTNSVSGKFGIGYSHIQTLTDTLNVDGTLLVTDDIKQSAGDNYASGGYRLLARNQTSGRFEQMTALLTSTGDTAVRFANSFQGTLKIANVSDADHTWEATESIVAYTSLSANRVVTVNPATLNPGVIYTLKDKGGLAATYSLTLNLSSGTIDGLASIDINNAFGYVSFYSDGTNLVIVSKD